jgi:tetratricopeptide (TPR) repeat protein
MKKTGAVLALLCLCRLSYADDPLALARGHYSAATKAYEVGQFDEAIKQFAEAYKLKEDPGILFNLAQAHRLAKHRDEAVRMYRMYLLKSPNAANRAEVERYLTSLQAAPSVSNDDPDTEVARRYYRAGAQLYAAEHYQEAIVQFEKARALKPVAGLDYNIARCHDRLGNFAEALVAYRRYVETRPSDADEVRARITILEQRTQPGAHVEPLNAAPELIAVGAPPDRPRRRAWVAPVAVVVAVAVAGLAVGLGVGLGAGGTTTDPTPSLGVLHWKK